MKVCLISGEYPPMQGGVGDYTRELARALAAQGVEVCVVTSVRAAQGDPAEPMVVHPVVENWGWGCWGPIMARASEHRADILHIQYQAAAYNMHPAINLFPLYLRLRRAIQPSSHLPPCVVTYHDLRVPYLFPKAGSLRRWVTLALARWSQVAIATNVQDLLSLRSHWPPPPPPVLRGGIGGGTARLSLIPIGSNIAPQPPQGYDRAAWRKRWGVEPGEMLLSYFGFLSESKGGETLIQALAELARQGLPVRLLMVGGQVGDSDPTNVAYLRKVEEFIRELDLADRILWTGFTPDEEVSANLLASDICVLPYRDGASFRRGSFMAALAHGLPVVTTQPSFGSAQACTEPGRSDRSSYPSLPDLVDGENVCLVPADDPAALARAIAGLMADPALRQRLARGAQALAAHFTWHRIARDTIRVYEQVCRRSQW